MYSVRDYCKMNNVKEIKVFQQEGMRDDVYNILQLTDCESYKQALYRLMYNQVNQIFTNKEGRLIKLKGLNYKITIYIDNLNNRIWGIELKNDIINFAFKVGSYIKIITKNNEYLVNAIKKDGKIVPCHSKQDWEYLTDYYKQQRIEKLNLSEKIVIKEGIYQKIEALQLEASNYGIDVSFYNENQYSGINATLQRKDKNYSDYWSQRLYNETFIQRPQLTQIDIERIENAYTSLQYFKHLVAEGIDLVKEGFLDKNDFTTCPHCGHPVKLNKTVKNLINEDFQQIIELEDTECQRCSTLITITL